MKMVNSGLKGLTNCNLLGSDNDRTLNLTFVFKVCNILQDV